MTQTQENIVKQKFSPKVNYAFIDNENVNVSVQKQGWKMDWELLIAWLKKKYKVGKVFMFMGYIEKYKEMYNFFEGLGYTLIFKYINPNPKIPNKGNTDAEMVLHTMIEYNNYDKAVIVTGDGDFMCLIEYLRKQKKLETLIVPNTKRYAYTLDEASGGNLVTFTDFKKVLEYDSNRKKQKEKPVLDESFYDTFYS